METLSILVSQRQLKRHFQVPSLVVAVKAGIYLPPIILNRRDDGLVQLEDGHHRLAAYYLAGVSSIPTEGYLLLEKDRKRPTFGNIRDLLERVKLVL